VRLKFLFEEMNISASNRTELIDITDKVERFVNDSDIKNGICLVSTLHSTTAVIVNENERGLMNDILRKIDQEFPKNAGWSHDRIDNNAGAHLASTFIGPSRTLPIKDGRLLRGTWQNIFLLELDGPRNRRIVVEVLGE
jgi:secondary thiamine-phosphate synthase enzyme